MWVATPLTEDEHLYLKGGGTGPKGKGKGKGEGSEARAFAARADMAVEWSASTCISHMYFMCIPCVSYVWMMCVLMPICCVDGMHVYLGIDFSTFPMCPRAHTHTHHTQTASA